MNIRMLGDAYDDHMRSAYGTPATVASSPGGFWATVGNLLTNRGVVQVQKPKDTSVMSYAILGVVAAGTLYLASKG